MTILQQFLSQDPTIYPDRLVTGYFGPLTEKAVKNFQAKNGLYASGKADSATRSRMNSVYGGRGSQIAATPSPAPPPTATPAKLTPAQLQALIDDLRKRILELQVQLLQLQIQELQAKIR